jgi:hypothetical protein
VPRSYTELCVNLYETTRCKFQKRVFSAQLLFIFYKMNANYSFRNAAFLSFHPRNNDFYYSWTEKEGNEFNKAFLFRSYGGGAEFMLMLYVLVCIPFFSLALLAGSSIKKVSPS